MWRTTPGLQRGVERDVLAGANDELCGAAAYVEDQGRLGGQTLGCGTQIVEACLLLAVDHPCGEGEALSQLGDEGASIGGISDGAGGDHIHGLRFCLVVNRDIVGDRVASGLDRLRGELSREVNAAPKPCNAAVSLDLHNLPVRDIGHQQSSRVGADIDDGHSLSIIGHEPALYEAMAASTRAPSIVPPNPACIASMGKPSRGGAAR